MKKLFALFLIVALSAGLAGCKKTTTTKATTTAQIPDPVSINVSGKADGYYFAAEDGFDGGYRYYAVLRVQGGKITEAEWNGYHIDGYASKCGGKDKVECAADGTYGMNKDNANMYWNKQAERVENFVKNKSLIELTYKADGKTDAISSVSVTVVNFFDLVKKALNNAPVTEGNFVDGYHTVKDADTVDATSGDVRFSFATFVVVNGRIVLADINAKYTSPNPEDAKKPFLTKDSSKGAYGMNKDKPDMWWNKQAERMESHIVSNQTLNGLNLLDVMKDGVATGDHTQDTIANVTIKVDGYIALWDQFKTAYTKA